MPSSMLTSRNSCAKAFGNWSRGKKISPKKPRGGGGDGGGGGVNEHPLPASSRVNFLMIKDAGVQTQFFGIGQ